MDSNGVLSNVYDEAARALKVSGATVTVDSEIPAAAALADNTANPTTPSLGAYLMEFDGTTWDRWRDPNKTAGTPTSTADNTVTNASEEVLAANANRKSAIIQVVSGGNARVRLDGGTATTSNGVQLVSGGPALIVSMPYCPTGAITAIREGGTDAVVHVTEIA